MTRTLLVLSILGTLLPAETLPVSQTPTERAWQILQRGLANKRAEKRANAAPWPIRTQTLEPLLQGPLVQWALCHPCLS